MIPRIPRITLNILLAIIYSFLILIAGSFIGGFIVGATNVVSTPADDMIIGICIILSIAATITLLIRYRKHLFILKP